MAPARSRVLEIRRAKHFNVSPDSTDTQARIYLVWRRFNSNAALNAGVTAQRIWRCG